jgi:hypothetical protein
MTDISRAQFLRGGAKGGLALVAGGTVLAAATGTASAATAAGDVEIAKVAATAELLAVDFYTRSIDSGVFGGRRERYLEGARSQERDHYDALARIIGPDAPRALTFKYPRERSARAPRPRGSASLSRTRSSARTSGRCGRCSRPTSRWSRRGSARTSRVT